MAERRIARISREVLKQRKVAYSTARSDMTKSLANYCREFGKIKNMTNAKWRELVVRGKLGDLKKVLTNHRKHMYASSKQLEKLLAKRSPLPTAPQPPEVPAPLVGNSEPPGQVAAAYATTPN